jgi:hypothetical protein
MLTIYTFGRLGLVIQSDWIFVVLDRTIAMKTHSVYARLFGTPVRDNPYHSLLDRHGDFCVKIESLYMVGAVDVVLKSSHACPALWAIRTLISMRVIMMPDRLIGLYPKLDFPWCGTDISCWDHTHGRMLNSDLLGKHG